MYIALRSLRVQTAKGRYEMRKPGDRVPEAAKWPNPALWEKRGFIKREDGKETPRGMANAYQPPRPVTPADLKAKEQRRELLENGVLPPVTDFEPAGPGNIGPVDGEPIVPKVPDEEPAAAAPAEASDTSLEELLSLSRKDLVDLAGRMGVDVKPKDSVKKIAKAILAAGAGQ